MRHNWSLLTPQVNQGIDILPLNSWGHGDKESFSKHRAWISHSSILCSTQDCFHSLLTHPNIFLTASVFVSDAQPHPTDIYLFSASHGAREAGEIEPAWRQDCVICCVGLRHFCHCVKKCSIKKIFFSVFYDYIDIKVDKIQAKFIIINSLLFFSDFKINQN